MNTRRASATFRTICLAALIALLVPAALSLAAMPDADFVVLCGQGEVAKVRQALADGSDPNAEADENGQTPLMAAARAGRAGIVAVLLEAGADSALIDADGHDALWHARQSAGEDRAAVIRLLLGGAEGPPDALQICLDRSTAAEAPAQAAQDCHAESIARWNRRLNANYRKARATCEAAADPAPCRWRLQEAQRYWLRYRDAMREAFGQIAPDMGPDVAPPHGFDQRATQNQAEELERFARQGKDLGTLKEATPPPDNTDNASP